MADFSRYRRTEGHAEDWDYVTALYKKMGGKIKGGKSLSGIDWTNHPLIKE